MKTKTVLCSLAVALVLTGPVHAAGKGQGIGNQLNQAVIAHYEGEGIDARTPDQSEGTSMGDAVQGGFYGNAANPRASGHGTLPSQSPGPFVNNPSDPDNPTRGSSWGAYKNADTTDDAAAGLLNPSNH